MAGAFHAAFRRLRFRRAAPAVAIPSIPTRCDPCPLCGRVEAFPVCERDGKTGAPLRVVACAACGFVRQDPLPDVRALAAFYRERYRVAYKGVHRPKLKHVWRAANLALERFRFLAPFVRPGARVLDVGAGGGEFVSLLARRGFLASGIEPNRGYAEFARECYGIDVRVGVLEDVSADGEPHDAITMFHVLEHVADPVATLIDLRRRLAPGGTLVVEVPNVEYLRGAPTNMFFAAHVHYFGARTLLEAAECAGLELVSRRPDPRAVNLRIALRACDERAAAARAYEDRPAADARAGVPEPARERTTHRPPADAMPQTARRALRAQALRTWGRYLHWRRALPRLRERLFRMRTERGLGDRFGDARTLLDACFGTARGPAAAGRR